MRHSALRRSWAAAIALLAVLALAPQAGFAAVPQTINYQGSLSNSAGQPVTTATNITFRLYDAETGGTLLWSETQSVTPTTGVFNVTLGADDVTPNLLDASWFDNPVWLSIEIEADGEMAPRQAITAVGYALRALSAENDADTVGALSCAAGEGPSWNGSAWVCAADADTQLTEGQVETFVTNGVLDFFAGSTLGGAAIQTGTEADTLAGLACTSGQVASWNGTAWVCAADADTQLTEGQVETFVTNGVVDLFAGTTLGGAAIQTGTEADTLAGLSCTSGQVASWNGSAWVCAADADTQLTEGQVETFVTNGVVDLFAGTTLGGVAIQTGTEADTLAGLSCTSGQVASWNGSAWVCAADADTGLTGANRVAVGPTSIAPSTPTTVTATCGGGDVALGGGWLADSSFIEVLGSYPNDPPTAWNVDVDNTDAVNHNVTAYVVCATP